MTKGKRDDRARTRDERRWASVEAREYEPTFVYAVNSTGIYCRSDCPSRRPLRKNVQFFGAPVAAEAAGYRACKRCSPKSPPEMEPAAHSVIAMCQMLEESDTEPSLEELAVRAGLSTSHAHRVFSRLTGLTPKAYRNAIVRDRVSRSLETHASVTQTVYASGFGAASRFYERVGHLLGMSPRQYRGGARGVSIRFAVGQCSLGAFLVAATERGVCAVYLGDEPNALISDLERRFPAAELICADAAFELTVARVVSVLETQSSGRPGGLPLDIMGTAFQERVYRALSRVQRSETISYSELARRVGLPKGARAVASACAKNELAVLVPCHRVVRTDGGLSGYRWGVERKRELLQRERDGRLQSARPC